MKNDVFSQDNQNVGNDISTNNNLDMGWGNNTNDLSANNLVNNNIGTESINATDNLTNDMNNTPPMMNSEVIGAVGNENITNINSSEVLPTDNNVNNNNNNSHKKLFIIIGIIVGVIILAIIAIFVYIKVGFTASKYIDEKVDEITTFVNEVFAETNYNNSSDSIVSGDVTINSNAEDMAALNGLKLNFEIGSSLTKEIVDINFGLEDYSANLYINNSRMYFDAKDIYSTPLYMDLEDNPFANLDMEDINIENYKKAIVNFVEYLGLALKEADMSSSIKGLNAVYKYEINDNNKEKFASKLNELIEQDQNMIDFLKMLGVSDTTVSADNLSNMVFEVTVSIPSGDLKGFTLAIEDSEISLVENSKNNFDLKIDNEVVAKVTVDGDNVTIKNTDTNTGNFDITFNTKDYTMKTSFESDGNIISLDITNASDTVKNIAMELISNNETSKTTINLDLTVEKISDSEVKSNGSLAISSGEYSINLDFNLNSQNGSDLVKEKTFSGAKDMNTLTTVDENEISENLMNILGSIAPEVSEGLEAQQFLLIAQINASTASSSVYPGACITLDQLGNDGTVWGKVESDSTSGYTISITDGKYMILNKYLDYGEELQESDVELYDQSRFTDQYYTCLAS